VCGGRIQKCARTPTPPLGDEESARCRSTGLLGQDSPDAPNAVGVLTDKTRHRCRSDGRIRIEILVAYSTVECSQTRRGGRPFRATSPRLRRCQSVCRCPWLRAAWARGPALFATDRQVRPAVAESIGHRMSGETPEYTSEQAMRGRA